MGATNCPETPRQKMIGMMYLVLTAMLALNVSKDILNAFAIVDETLVNARVITEKNIGSDASKLEQQKVIYGEEKVKGAMEMYKKVDQQSDELVKYIEQIIVEVIRAVDGTEFNEETGKVKTVKEINSKDNISIPTEYMMGLNKNGKGYELKAKIAEYRKNMLSVVEKPVDRKMLDESMPLKVDAMYKNNDGKDESWEVHYFNGTIAVATVTLLNEIIGEVREVQSSMMSYVVSSISADDFKFNQIAARAIPESKIVFQGEAYKADVIVAALDTLQNPEVFYKMGVDSLTEAHLESATKVIGKGGKVTLELPAGSAGDVKYAGLIKIMGPDGNPRTYNFSEAYTVLKPTATVAAEKMNVLYIGIPNPLSVACPVPPDKVNISMSGGSATKTGPGTYDAIVPESLRGKTVDITVTADGKNMGSTQYRVKAVPNPQAAVGGSILGGKVTKVRLNANPFIIAKMPEDFVYDLKWKVQSYVVTFVSGGMESPPIPVKGANFPENVKDRIKKAGRGTTIFFTGIKANSPAGTRTLTDIVVRVK